MKDTRQMFYNQFLWRRLNPPDILAVLCKEPDLDLDRNGARHDDLYHEPISKLVFMKRDYR